MKSALVTSTALNVEGKPPQGRHKAHGNVFHGILKSEGVEAKVHVKAAKAEAEPRTTIDALVERLSKSLEMKTGDGEAVEPVVSKEETPTGKNASKPRDKQAEAADPVAGFVQPPAIQPHVPEPEVAPGKTETAGEAEAEVVDPDAIAAPPKSGPAQTKVDHRSAVVKTDIEAEDHAADARHVAEGNEEPQSPKVARTQVAQRPVEVPSSVKVAVEANADTKVETAGTAPAPRNAEARPVIVLQDAPPEQPRTRDTASALEATLATAELPDDQQSADMPTANAKQVAAKVIASEPKTIDAKNDISAPKPHDLTPAKVELAEPAPAVPPDEAPKTAAVSAAANTNAPKPQAVDRRRPDDAVPVRAEVISPADKDPTIEKSDELTIQAREKRDRVWERPSADQQKDAAQDDQVTASDIRAAVKADAAPALPATLQPAARPAAPAVTVVAAISTAHSTQELAKALDVNVTASTSPSTQVLKIQLHPGEMGVVTATLRMSGDQISVDLATDNNEAFDRLSTDTDTIVKSLRGLGLQVDQITVSPPQVAANGPTSTGDSSMQNAPQRDPRFAQAGGSPGNGQSNGQSGNGQNRGTQDDGARYAAGGSGSREQRDRGLVI